MTDRYAPDEFQMLAAEDQLPEAMEYLRRLAMERFNNILFKAIPVEEIVSEAIEVINTGGKDEG